MKNNETSDFLSGIFAAVENTRDIHRAAKQMRAFEKACSELSDLNTMRGGSKGFKGFVGESMEAAEASARGRSTVVLNNNGIADLQHIKTNGTTALKQMKMGYKPGQIDFARYKGQSVVLDRGNPHFAALKAEGAKHGVKVVEGHVTQGEAKFWADAMQLESKVTGSKNSFFVPKAYQGAKSVVAAHHAGTAAAKSGAAAGAGFSLGKNAMQVMKGNKSVADAVEDVAVDTVEAGAVSYGVGTVGSLVASTEIGASAIGAASAVGTAAANAPIIGSALGAGTSLASAIGGVGASGATMAAGALTGAVGSLASAASGLAAGTAAAGAVGTVSAAAVAGAAALGTAAVAAAPVLAVGCVLGGIFSFFRD